MYVHVCTCMYLYIYVCIYQDVHVCTYIYTCVYTRMYMYVLLCIFKRSKHVPSKIATVFIFKSLPHNYCLALLSALMIVDRKQSASYHYFIAGLMSQDKIYYSHMCSVVVCITHSVYTYMCE